MKFTPAWLRLLALIFLTKLHLSFGEPSKLCAFPYMELDHCKSIEFGNSNVTCVKVIDSVDCFLKLNKGEADFAVLLPEESVFLSKKDNVDLQVIGEVRYKRMADEPSSVSMVVIIRKEFSGKFIDLQGKKYCHPGVGTSHEISDHFLTYFERVLVQSTCTNEVSAKEQEIKSLGRFFGDSCRPGTWAQTRSLDRRLKMDNRNLCRLCDSLNRCANNLDTTNAFEAALECLTAKSGEIAYVPLENVQQYFGLKPGLIKKNNADDYVYLCKDERTMPISTDSPCIWGKQPWNLVVARKDVSAALKQSMPDWLSPASSSSRPGDKWMQYLRQFLLGDYKLYKHNRTQDPIPLNNYVDRGGVDDVNVDADCRDKVRWCNVGNKQKEKCDWISLAAKALGIQPQISCVHHKNVFNCLSKISQNAADAISIYSEYGYISRRVYNLSTIVYEDNIIAGNYQILTVLKKDNQDIQSFKDLRGKNACFPEYNGLAWISFINTAKMYNILGKTCPEYFFGPSCVPGALKQTHTIPGSTSRPLSMCSICPPSNSSDFTPPYVSVKENNVRAMQCLSMSGDVAFVNYKSLVTGGDKQTVDERISPDLFKVLCKNGTIVSGLFVDDNCALSTGINAEVVGRTNEPSVKSIDTAELFLELNKAFGLIGPGEKGGVIHMFDQFKGETNLLFKETTISLANSDEDQFFEQIDNYKSLMDNVTGTCKGSAHYTTLLSLELFVVTIFAWVFMV